MGKLELIFSFPDLSPEILGQQQFEIDLIVYTKYFYWHIIVNIVLMIVSTVQIYNNYLKLQKYMLFFCKMFCRLSYYSYLCSRNYI